MDLWFNGCVFHDPWLIFRGSQRLSLFPRTSTAMSWTLVDCWWYCSFRLCKGLIDVSMSEGWYEEVAFRKKKGLRRRKSHKERQNGVVKKTNDRGITQFSILCSGVVNLIKARG